VFVFVFVFVFVCLCLCVCVCVCVCVCHMDPCFTLISGWLIEEFTSTKNYRLSTDVNNDDGGFLLYLFCYNTVVRKVCK
jgi:hypothetical protein